MLAWPLRRRRGDDPRLDRGVRPLGGARPGAAAVVRVPGRRDDPAGPPAVVGADRAERPCPDRRSRGGAECSHVVCRSGACQAFPMSLPDHASPQTTQVLPPPPSPPPPIPPRPPQPPVPPGPPPYPEPPAPPLPNTPPAPPLPPLAPGQIYIICAALYASHACSDSRLCAPGQPGIPPPVLNTLSLHDPAQRPSETPRATAQATGRSSSSRARLRPRSLRQRCPCTCVTRQKSSSFGRRHKRHSLLCALF